MDFHDILAIASSLCFVLMMLTSGIEYKKMKKQNEELLQENARLLNQIQKLKQSTDV